MTRLFKPPSSLMAFFCSALLLLIPSQLTGQTAPIPTSDPSAVALASRALQSLAGRTALTDITLQGSAHLILGSDEETGTATLVARGNAQSLVTLNLTNGQRQEIRSGAAGAWVDNTGTPHGMATHNCWVDAPWFFPALSMSALATDPTLVISLVGEEMHEGQPVYHLSLLRSIQGQTADVVSLVQRISGMDLYLDASSLLPEAFAYNAHADNDANLNIPTEIRFGTYQAFNGVKVPTRVQKYLQNSLVLDLIVANVAVNSGVADSAFMLPYASSGGTQ